MTMYVLDRFKFTKYLISSSSSSRCARVCGCDYDSALLLLFSFSLRRIVFVSVRSQTRTAPNTLTHKCHSDKRKKAKCNKIFSTFLSAFGRKAFAFLCASYLPTALHTKTTISRTHERFSSSTLPLYKWFGNNEKPPRLSARQLHTRRSRRWDQHQNAFDII